MNYIDAHKIIYDYINVASQQADEGLPARRLSTLRNSKRDIINAYKLFVAHMFVFDTCSQEEYENLTTLVYSIGLFVDDVLIAQLEECQSIMSSKSNNRKVIDDATKQYEDLSKRLIKEIEPLGPNKEISAFISSIVPIAKTYKKRVFSVPDGGNKLAAQLEIINEYCYQVYSVAEITMFDDDVEFFYPIKLLQFFANNPKLDSLIGKYKDYIFSSM